MPLYLALAHLTTPSEPTSSLSSSACAGCAPRRGVASVAGVPPSARAASASLAASRLLCSRRGPLMSRCLLPASLRSTISRAAEAASRRLRSAVEAAISARHDHAAG